MERFVVMSTQRSGTTWLVSLLDSHKHITCAGEMLYPEFEKCKGITYHQDLSLGYFLNANPEKYNALAQKPRDIIFEYLDQFYGSIKETPAAGFKLMFAHIQRFPDVIEYLRSRNIKIILLLRTNLVDMLISQALFAIRHNEDSRTLVDKIKSIVRGYRFARKNSNGLINLNIEYSMKCLAQYEYENETLQQYAKQFDTLTIYYEDLANQTEDILQSVFSFIHAEPMPASSKERKVRTKEISEIVANYTQLEDRLKGTRFQQFLRKQPSIST